MKTTRNTKHQAPFAAGRATALADFGKGRFFMPAKRDNAQWSAGYKAAVTELAETYGRDAIHNMGGTIEGRS